jgi:hypothetical protein
MVRRLLLRVLVLVGLFLSSSGHAATALMVPFDELVCSSALVFHGRVAAVHTVNLNNAGHPRLVTDTTFEVILVWKGEPSWSGNRFTLRQTGGRLDGYTLLVPGQPVFRVGQEVVAFLEWTGRNWTLTGMKQGVFRVSRRATGESRGTRELSGMNLLFLHDPSGMECRQEDYPTELTLEDLFGRVVTSPPRGETHEGQ